MSESPPALLLVLDPVGVFVFALSGGWVAVRKGMDLVGVASLSLVTGLAGGVARDVLLGHLPPRSIQAPTYILLALLASAVVVVVPGLVKRFSLPMLVFDALGLGLFSAVGAIYATTAGVGLAGATLVGTISAVGGGVVRDVLADEVPQVFGEGSELYAIPALAGALAASLIWRLGFGHPAAFVGCILGVVTLRLLAVKYGWHSPVPRSIWIRWRG